MKAAHVPEKTAFATKPALAVAMIERAIATAVPFAWVAADSVYGVAGVEMALRRAGKGYVLGVASNHSVNSWGKASLSRGRRKASRKAWRLRTGNAYRRAIAPRGRASTTGLMWNWPISRPANQRKAARGFGRAGLLISRTIADQDLAFFSTWAPAGASIEKLVRVEGCRWAIEDSFETAKNELGLDHNETRSWHGWNRHVSLVMLAFAMMAAVRCQAIRVLAEPKRRLKIPPARRLSAGPFRKSAA